MVAAPKWFIYFILEECQIILKKSLNFFLNQYLLGYRSRRCRANWPPAGVAAPINPESTKKPIDTWDKDKDGKEIGHTRGAKLVSGGARIANMANKTKHICG